ncbi:hypothetical protein ACFL4W_00925 [Planctomycetota bacterium]
MAIGPDVLKKLQGSEKTFSLTARDLPVETFLNWTARLMECHYVQGSSPDVWFVSENRRLTEADLTWQSYPAFLIDVNESPVFAQSIFVEMQKGISWLRADAKTVHDESKHRCMINSTSAGHARMKKLVDAFTDRKFIPFERVGLEDVVPSETILRSKVPSPEAEETLDHLVKRIVKGTRLNIGYDSSHQLGRKKPLTIAVPLEEYSVKALLARIMEQTPYKDLHWETPLRLWLKHENEDLHIANRYLPWDSMDVYLLWIGSVSRVIRGRDIARGIRQSVYSTTWSHPGTVIKYINSLDLLIIVNQKEAVRETVRFLNFIKKFKKLPHGGR